MLNNTTIVSDIDDTIKWSHILGLGVLRDALDHRLAFISTWDHRGFIALHLAAAVRKNAALLLDDELVQHYLKRLQATHPVLVRAVLERFDGDTLLELLRRKLQAQASIRNMLAVLDELLESTLPQ